MTRKVFTDEEIEMIRQNPHTRSVTSKTIKFTQEFKDLFFGKSTRTASRPVKFLKNTVTRRKFLAAHWT